MIIFKDIQLIQHLKANIKIITILSFTLISFSINGMLQEEDFATVDFELINRRPFLDGEEIEVKNTLGDQMYSIYTNSGNIDVYRLSRCSPGVLKLFYDESDGFCYGRIHEHLQPEFYEKFKQFVQALKLLES